MRFFYCFVFSKITNKRICICLIQMQGREEEVNEDWHRRSEERGCQRGRGGRGGPWRVLTLSNAGGEEEEDGNADTHEAAGITENGRGSIGVEEECDRDK